MYYKTTLQNLRNERNWCQQNRECVSIVWYSLVECVDLERHNDSGDTSDNIVNVLCFCAVRGWQQNRFENVAEVVRNKTPCSGCAAFQISGANVQNKPHQRVRACGETGLCCMHISGAVRQYDAPRCRASPSAESRSGQTTCARVYTLVSVRVILRSLLSAEAKVLYFRMKSTHAHTRARAVKNQFRTEQR